MAELKSLKSQIKTIKQRGDDLSEQRVRESAMFQSDCTTLRQRVNQYERHIKRLKMFVDKEDTEALVQELEQEKNLPDLSQIAKEIEQVARQIADARKVKI